MEKETKKNFQKKYKSFYVTVYIHVSPTFTTVDIVKSSKITEHTSEHSREREPKKRVCELRWPKES